MSAEMYTQITWYQHCPTKTNSKNKRKQQKNNLNKYSRQVFHTN